MPTVASAHSWTCRTSNSYTRSATAAYQLAHETRLLRVERSDTLGVQQPGIAADDRDRRAKLVTHHGHQLLTLGDQRVEVSPKRLRLAPREIQVVSRLVGAVALRLGVRAVESAIGGGALPLTALPSRAVVISGAGAERVDALLRAAPTPVVGRIVEDRLCLDVRTLIDEQDEIWVAEAIQYADQKLG